MVAALELTAMTEVERRLLYLFLFDHAEWQIGELCSAMRSKIGRYTYDIPPTKCIESCESLCAKGFLRRSFEPKTPKSKRYASLGSKLSLDAARLLLGEAVRKDWVVGSSGWLSYSNRKKDVIMGLAALLDGGKGYSMPRDRWDVVDAVWEEAVRFVGFLGTDTAVPQMNFPASTSPFVFRVLASVLFCRGLDVSSVLENWHRHLSKKGGADEIGSCNVVEYAALCVWTGHVDWLDALDVGSKSAEVVSFVAACRDVAKGDLASAAKGMAFMDSYPAKRSTDYESNLASMPASHLLALLVTAFAKPVKARIEKLAGTFYPLRDDFREGLPRAVRAWFRLRIDNSASYFHLVRLPGYIGDGYDWNSPVCESGEIVRALVSDMGRDEAEKESHRLFARAQRAMDTGLPTLAGAYLSAFGWTFKDADADGAERLAREIAERGDVWFRPYEKTANPWKLVVAAFDKCLPASGKVESKSEARAKSGRLVWALSLVATT